MRKRTVLYGPIRADVFCTLEEQPDGGFTVTYTEPRTVPLGRVPTQAEAEALARQWACERPTPGKWSAADLDAQHAAWEDTLALIEIHAGARCEVLPDPDAPQSKRWLTVEQPTRARATDTADGRWRCIVQGQQCLVQSIEATVLEESTAKW